MIFDFIHDPRFKVMLERDYEELTNCLSVQAAKAVLILSGSIVESVLTDYFSENLPPGQSKSDILKSNLATLLGFAESENLISSKEKKLGEIIKDFRNLIHPGKEVRSSEEFDFETAKLSKILLDIVLNKLRNNHVQKYDYGADEIVEKLKNDWQFNSIYRLVITRLNHMERANLLKRLVEVEELYKSNFEHYKLLTDSDPKSELYKLNNLEDIKPKVQELKPLIKSDTIKEYLHELKKSIIHGESIKALTLYNLFHEDVITLSTEDQELIAIYMLSLYESIFENSRELSNDKTYSTIGKYIHTPDGILQLMSLGKFCIVHFGGQKVIEAQMDVFQQIFNSISPHVQTELQSHLDNFLPNNRVDLENYDLNYFYDEAVKRKILNEKYN